jgi:putative SOS response-associated peptidase YedK
MCGRYAIVHDLLGIKSFFGVQVVDGDPELQQVARYNVAPTQDCWVVYEEESRQERHLGQMRWGLIPSWAKSEDVPSIGSRMTNARSESVLEKPSFKRAILTRRCLIPASAFYEWKVTESGRKKIKVPQKIDSPDLPLLAMAGIFEKWGAVGSGKEYVTFSILTRDANAFMRQIHDRMPVFVPQDHWSDWLSRKENRPESVRHWITELQSDGVPPLQSRPITTALNSPKNEGPDLWERKDEGDPQGSLF